jgi:sortase A
MKVNTTATKEATHRVSADVVWDPSYEVNTNSVSFRVLPSSSLPGTGGYYSAAITAPSAAVLSAAVPSAEAGVSTLPRMLGLVALGLLILGLAALSYSLWARRRRPLWAGWYGRAGLILLIAGAFFAVAAWGLGQATPRSPQLASLSGEKPPLPTSSAPRITLQPRPTKTRPPEDLTQYLPTPTPLALPDYPIPTPEVTVTPSADGSLPDSSAVTRIVIPSLGVDTVVKYVPFDGETWLIGGLRQEVAWMGDTSWPGLGGNTGVAGHIDLFDGSEGPFSRLDELKPGDQVILYTEKNAYHYTVREQVVVSDTDMSVIQRTENPQLTLITCTGWDNELKLYLKRLVVFSDLVNVDRLPTTLNTP